MSARTFWRAVGSSIIPVLCVVAMGGVLFMAKTRINQADRAVPQLVDAVQRPLPEVQARLAQDGADARALGTVLLQPDGQRTKIGWMRIGRTTCQALAEYLGSHPDKANATSLTIDGRFQDNLAKPDGPRSACRKGGRYPAYNVFLWAKTSS